MRPILVAVPVATTTPGAWPTPTTVPAWAMLRRSPSDALGATASQAWSAATDQAPPRITVAWLARPAAGR